MTYRLLKSKMRPDSYGTKKPVAKITSPVLQKMSLS